MRVFAFALGKDRGVGMLPGVISPGFWKYRRGEGRGSSTVKTYRVRARGLGSTGLLRNNDLIDRENGASSFSG